MTNQSPNQSYRFLSGNTLKLIAAFFMTLDHMGELLFPHAVFLRILGRIAMPIFAYMIAEGCKYTRNRRKYFGTIFALGAVCQVVYYFVDRSLYMSILITFSLSILTIYALQYWKEKKTVLSGLVFAGAVAVVYGLNRLFTIDYGFWGCMLPVFAALPHGTKHDRDQLSSTLLGVGLIPLSLSMGSIQIFSLMALPFLYCYTGKRGKANLKYFFYIFYPAHLAVLQAIAWLL